MIKMSNLNENCRFCGCYAKAFANISSNLWAQEFGVCFRPKCTKKAKYLLSEYSPINHESKEKFKEMQQKYLIKRGVGDDDLRRPKN